MGPKPRLWPAENLLRRPLQGGTGMSWDEIVSALSMLWARQKPELLQLLQPGLNKALRLALVGTVLMAVLLAGAAGGASRKKAEKGACGAGYLPWAVRRRRRGAVPAAPRAGCRCGRGHGRVCLSAQRAGCLYLCALYPSAGERRGKQGAERAGRHGKRGRHGTDTASGPNGAGAGRGRAGLP